MKCKRILNLLAVEPQGAKVPLSPGAGAEQLKSRALPVEAVRSAKRWGCRYLLDNLRVVTERAMTLSVFEYPNALELPCFLGVFAPSLP